MRSVSIIETPINCQSRFFLHEEKLAEIIRTLSPPGEFSVQVANFFTEVPVHRILRFAREHGIPDEVLKEYYEKYVKEIYPNRALEAVL